MRRKTSKCVFQVQDRNSLKEHQESIAKFMGMIQHPQYGGWAYEDTIVYDDDGVTMIGAEQWWSSMQLEYDWNWNWVHEVLEKITKSGCIVELSDALVFTCRICVIGRKNEKSFNIIHDNNGGKDPLEATYNAIIEFIHWHNENRKK